MGGPSRAPGDDLALPPLGDDPGSQLRTAGEYGRAEPKTWVFVGASTSPLSEVTTRWVRPVREGRKPSLGPGRWDAHAERGVVRDGEPFTLADVGEPEPGEAVVTLKWVAFLGDDDTDA